MDLSIIIVTWNNEKEIGSCLRAVLACSEGLSVETIVIDNASSDKTRERIDASLEQTKGDNEKTIYNKKNLGFAAAVNQGIAASRGEFILLLNPDTAVHPGSLQTMVRYLRARSEVGVAGGKILNVNGSIQPSVRRFPTILDQAIILLKLHNFFPAILSKYFLPDFKYEIEQEVDQVRGAYFWITRNLLDKIGPLDAKNFFIWFEEVDYCRRAKDAGYKVTYFPGSMATHEGGASFGRQRAIIKQLRFDRSLVNYFRKHGVVLDVLTLSLLVPVSLLMAVAVQMLKIKQRKYV